LSRKGLSACLKGIDRIFLSYFAGKQIGPNVSKQWLIEIIPNYNVKGTSARLNKAEAPYRNLRYRIQAAIKRRAGDNVPKKVTERELRKLQCG